MSAKLFRIRTRCTQCGKSETVEAERQRVLKLWPLGTRYVAAGWAGIYRQLGGRYTGVHETCLPESGRAK